MGVAEGETEMDGVLVTSRVTAGVLDEDPVDVDDLVGEGVVVRVPVLVGRGEVDGVLMPETDRVGVRVLDTVCIGVDVVVRLAEGVGVVDRDGLVSGVREDVPDAVGVRVRENDGVTRADRVTEGVAVLDALLVAVGDRELIGERDSDRDAERVGVILGVRDLLGEGVGVREGERPMTVVTICCSSRSVPATRSSSSRHSGSASAAISPSRLFVEVSAEENVDDKAWPCDTAPGGQG